MGKKKFGTPLFSGELSTAGDNGADAADIAVKPKSDKILLRQKKKEERDRRKINRRYLSGE